MRHVMHKNSGRLNLGWVLFGGLALLGTAGCTDMGTDAGEGDDKATFSSKVVLDWNAHALGALSTAFAGLDPLVATRVMSMVHVSMHDAINSADREFERYSYIPRDSTAHPVAAAAAAAHRVLVNQFPGQAADFDAKLNASRAEVPDGLGETRGRALGDQVANHILQLRANDGSGTPAGYTPGTGAGKYQFVPPFEGFIYRPEWRFVTPWVLSSPGQFRSAAPPALNTNGYRDSYNIVKAAGVLTGSNRTAEQTTYAKFWYENSDEGWNKITRDASVRKGLDLHRSARLFALVNMAMADGYIAGWESKFHYDLWRPFTGIRNGNSDPNPNTVGDPNWQPLLATPPVQDYPSTHSVLGKAAAQVLGRVLGDRTTFSFTSTSAENPALPRTYTSFSAAAAENGDSRIRAGLHFPFAVTAGITMGEKIGNRAVDYFLEND
jgi:hypothetical protein